MLGNSSRAHAGRAAGIVATLAILPLTVTAIAPSETQAGATHEITVTVARVKALDAIDTFSKGDFYAKVTIDGQNQSTPVVKQDAEIKPNWKISKKVAPGKIKVKLELLDKDISADDPIDINKVDKKRDLDFVVDTRTCRTGGFSQTYRCGATITRAGAEKKKAEIAFSVSVKK